MRTIFFLLVLTSSTLDGFAQRDRFQDYNDSMLVVSCFQSDVIKDGGLKEEFATHNQDLWHEPIIVYQIFKESASWGLGDPMCMWLHQSAIDTLVNLRWVRYDELIEKGNWVHLNFKILEKKNGQTQILAHYHYKIRKTRIGLGPRNYYRKVRVRKFSS